MRTITQARFSGELVLPGYGFPASFVNAFTIRMFASLAASITRKI